MTTLTQSPIADLQVEKTIDADPAIATYALEQYYASEDLMGLYQISATHINPVQREVEIEWSVTGDGEIVARIPFSEYYQYQIRYQEEGFEAEIEEDEYLYYITGYMPC